MKTIKDMPEHSHPREKLREKGASALTDEELVTAILGMGRRGLICTPLPGNWQHRCSPSLPVSLVFKWKERRTTNAEWWFRLP